MKLFSSSKENLTPRHFIIFNGDHPAWIDLNQAVVPPQHS